MRRPYDPAARARANVVGSHLIAEDLLHEGIGEIADRESRLEYIGYVREVIDRYGLSAVREQRNRIDRRYIPEELARAVVEQRNEHLPSEGKRPIGGSNHACDDP